MSTAQSEMMLIADVARIDPFTEIQVPGSVGSQSFSRGTQAQMKDIKMAKENARFAQIITWIHQYI